ncbi:uncharacterized protein LOC112679917 isoform X1 [Sipha flava]|uniref:Uncharacterized protein LOC112679917 isoform X1 n=1 Tax=Sipha flava TaxID=143950 RepID=A0A8B8F5P1_9HEMI|nr:uncharacterized protein LOC112679917 isoform X1 [Sipha flava]
MCGVKYEPNSEIKCHAFSKDESRKGQWKKACEINLCLSTSRVCSNHFLPADYELSGLLKRDAAPCKQNISINQENSTATITDTNITNHSDNNDFGESCLESEICVTPRKRKLDNVKDITSVQLSP